MPEPDTAWILYYWGSVLVPDTGAEVTVLAGYNATDQLAMLAFNYDSGRVFLVGTYPEIEEDSDRDGVTFGDKLEDQGSDWELMKSAAVWCLGILE